MTSTKHLLSKNKTREKLSCIKIEGRTETSIICTSTFIEITNKTCTVKYVVSALSRDKKFIRQTFHQLLYSATYYKSSISFFFLIFCSLPNTINGQSCAGDASNACSPKIRYIYIIDYMTNIISRAFLSLILSKLAAHFFT